MCLKKSFFTFLLSVCLVLCGLDISYASTTSEKLESAEKEASEAKEELDAAKKKLSDTQQELTDIMAAMAELEVDIEEKEAEIEENELALADAEEQELYQRTLMESRMQYMYENNGESFIVTILESKSLAEMLNKIEYMAEIYSEDKELTDSYAEVTDAIAELEKTLEAEYAEMLALEEDYSEREEELTALEETLSESVADYEGEYEEAAAVVAKYKARLSAELSSAASGGDTSFDESGYTDAVEYARQFIGYPYVYGGNSLTGGIDCSHFVWQVMKNTGHYSGSYRTSSGWRTVGTAVSKSDAQAGDILCYDGHVSIYSGEGTEIHARGRAYGICETTVSWSRVICVRRLS